MKVKNTSAVLSDRAAIQNNKLFLHINARAGVQAGVVIIHSCGTKQWIGNSFFDDIYITEKPYGN